MTTTRQWYKLLMLLGTMLTFVVLLDASASASFHSRNSGYFRNEQPDEYLMDLITRYGQTIMRARNDLENSKRTVDFGFSRGLSGAQEAKHRIGLATAYYANGPGRKRRSGTLTDELYDFN